MCIIISISLALNLLGFSGEEKGYSEHAERRSLTQIQLQKALPSIRSEKSDYPKEIYNLQFSEGQFYQVEKTYIENEYGSTKETQIYYKKDEHYHLLSRRELTDGNILSEQISQYTVQELEGLTIDNPS